MEVRFLETVKELEVICNSCDNEIFTSGYTSDLLSDVLANAEDESVFITIQAHKNSVAVSSIAGSTAIILCNSKKAPDDMIEAAEESGIALFNTTLNQFETSILIGNLLKVDK
jgi:hypothetical protein